MTENVSKNAPGELDVIRRFINTLDVESGADELDTLEALERWLHDEGLPHAHLQASDVALAHDLREGLRDVLTANTEGTCAPEAIQRLNAIGACCTLKVAFGPEGDARLEPTCGGFDATAAQLLSIVERAQTEGTWQRLKACAADDCRWAFYDQSRNRSRHWCSMAVCGNRAKARSYRERSGG